MNARGMWVGALVLVASAGCQSWEGHYQILHEWPGGIRLAFTLDVAGEPPEAAIDYAYSIFEVRSGYLCGAQVLVCSASIDLISLTFWAPDCAATPVPDSVAGCMEIPASVDVSGGALTWDSSQITQINVTDPFDLGGQTLTRCVPDVDC